MYKSPPQFSQVFKKALLKIFSPVIRSCMQIGVIGLNHKQASVDIREALAKVCTRHFGPHFSNRHPFVLLTTCNRTEIYFTSEDLAETQSYILNLLKSDLPFEVGQELYSFFSTDCFYHLSKVTSGFDSAILGETEIQGQVKTSYQQAHQNISLPFELHFLFQKALKIGKEIRTRHIFPKAIVDLEHAILHFGEHLSDPCILFVGASRTNLKIAAFLKKKERHHITFTNRTDDNAKMACAVDGYRFLPWSSKSTWHQFDWVIVATKADHYQLLTSDLRESPKTSLLIDLSVPRNIDPHLERHMPLINIDQVNDLLQRHSILEREVESWLIENAQKYIDLFHEKSDKLYVFA